MALHLRRQQLTQRLHAEEQAGRAGRAQGDRPVGHGQVVALGAESVVSGQGEHDVPGSVGLVTGRHR